MSDTRQGDNGPTTRRLPPWLKRPLPAGAGYADVERLLKQGCLNTVCRSARCPNLGECWSRRVATFMILGNVCTRNCRFCAVQKGPVEPLDPNEPGRVAEAARKMGLKHVVVTSVTRDDLPDEGAAHFAATIRALRAALPHSTVEVLVPDFHARPELLEIVCREKPDVFNHNVETVEALAPIIRPMADYRRSLTVLAMVARTYPDPIVKSGLMVGLGETETQVRQTLRDMAQTGCRVVTVGQYLAPSDRHHPVEHFYEPAWFEALTHWAAAYLPDLIVYAAPFVRSSYLAEKLFGQLRKQP
ncbi:MAG: lipoyl synthase [Phycisphaerae bacterium]|nr:lipoyl synthase [Phycisphaerae bacterium]